MASDLKFIILWWFITVIFSLSLLPLVCHIFRKFYDKGYVFAKVASFSLITFIVFVLGVFKLLPFTNIAIWSVWLILTVFSWTKYKGFKKILQENFKTFIWQEVFFLFVLILWSYIRGFSPEIDGLEKFMDWGFINSMLRTKYMPPADMWFSGMPINYYYFGHLVFATLTKISGISSAITYNLSIATICALTAVSSFSLSSNFIYFFLQKIKKINFQFIIIGGLVSSLLLSFGGNLHLDYRIAKNYIEKPNLKIAIRNYWYPDATRFIGYDPETKDKTIHEFPIYSFVVADLHGHMNDIPVVLFFIAFLFVSFSSLSVAFIDWSFVIPAGLILSIAYMTNAWDFAVYGLLYGVFAFIYNKNIYKTLLNGVLILIFWYLFTLPFSLNFVPMVEGIRLADQRTPFYQLFVLYGGFWLIIIPYILTTIFKIIPAKKLKLFFTDYFVLALILTATILVIIPEIVYIKDIYITEYRRANTMFKLVYQAFIMYSLVSGYVLIRLLHSLKNRKHFLLYKIIFLLVFISHLIYPYFAIKGFYSLKEYKGLWGLSYLERSNPSDLEAINWINKNISGQPVLLEAVGDSYTTYNQVSVATGLPTVEGWIVHEWLWRGSYDAPGSRATDVQKIYESLDIEETKKLIQKYNIEYIFVGPKEIEKYENINTEKFTEMGYPKIYESQESIIYRVRNS